MSALRTLTELRRELDALERLQARRGLASGRSFGELARALGISRQAAHRRYRQLTAERVRERKPQLVITGEARLVMRLARAETLACGGGMGSHHVLFAVLRTDGDAARALRAEDVTLQRARACAGAAGADARNADADATLRRILQQAVRLTLTRGDRRLGSEQLLLAALADPDDRARSTLTALGVAAASVRERLSR